MSFWWDVVGSTMNFSLGLVGGVIVASWGANQFDSGTQCLIALSSLLCVGIGFLLGRFSA
jgi:hypothetical protein